MRGGQKPKRVSWASDGNLCQVRLFLLEDAPSQVGFAAQDHLQAKRTPHISQASYLLQSNGLVSDDSLPPGFEEYSPAIQLKNRLAQIPLAKWICPPRFILNSRWQVVAGEESKEVGNENEREIRVLEAIYPRPSAIPPNAVDSLDKANPVPDDQETPLISITPIEEEEDATEDLPMGYASIATASFSPSASRLSHGSLSSSSESTSPQSVGAHANGKLGVGMMSNSQVNGKAELASVASTAAAGLMKTSYETRSLIDHDLLAKILGNPKILDELVQHQGASSSSENAPISLEAWQMAPQQQPITVPIGDPTPLPFFNKIESSSSVSVVAANGPVHSHMNGTTHVLPRNLSAPVSGVARVVPYAHSGSASLAKDTNYYKSLIQQHGGEKQPVTLPPAFIGSYNQLPGSSNDLMARSPNPMDYRSKVMKPCIFFNSLKGCRHGANCMYQHDPSPQQRVGGISPETQTTKRTKISEDRDIRGSSQS
ncbi:hypothetical protein Droror1_Dr00013725 [Drosera rotundifolia]